jgi:starch-binding outer membrane protein, SusD/RagB family
MKLFYILSISIGLVLLSCKKYVEIPPPDNQLVSGLVFTDDKTATATVAGLYSRLNAFNSSFANFNGNFLPAFSADEFHYAFSSANLDEFKENSLIPSNSSVNGLWEAPYSYIYHANSIIEGLSSSASISQPVKAQLTGEAKFIRGFIYFYLVNHFGDVPLVLNTDYKTNTSLPRTSVAEVYTSIINDFKDAQTALSENYPSAERTRVNKAAATTMLARTYLYTGQWNMAETEATKVISDTKYSLLTNLNSVFLKNSNEAIWQLQTVNTSTAGVNTWEGFSIVPATPTGTPLYVMYPDFSASFEVGDKRKEDWIKTFTNASGTVGYPFKYKVRTATPVVEYSMVLRFAELYLIRAEARAQQNNLNGAIDDLNKIRKRAGLLDLTYTLTKEQVLLAVEKERKLELFAEWGHRWLDLKRTGRALQVLSPIKTGLTANDLLYPIPLSAMLTNPNLVQNPGYF